MKTCTKCGVPKSQACFSGRNPWCKPCRVKHQQWYRKKPAMRVHKGSHHTTFSTEGKEGDIRLTLMRLFHPTRGEEVQVGIEIVKHQTYGLGKQRNVTTAAQVILGPSEAHDFAKPLLGNFQPAQVGAHNFGPARVHNAYTPVGYDKLPSDVKKLVQDAFEAGRCYEGSLAPQP